MTWCQEYNKDIKSLVVSKLLLTGFYLHLNSLKFQVNKKRCSVIVITSDLFLQQLCFLHLHSICFDFGIAFIEFLDVYDLIG